MWLADIMDVTNCTGNVHMTDFYHSMSVKQVFIMIKLFFWMMLRLAILFTGMENKQSGSKSD